MISTSISAKQQFLAFIQPDTNELHLWDIKGKSKCLQRFKPNKDKDAQKSNRFTSIAFSNQNDGQLTAGLSNGSLQVIDCPSAKVQKSLNQVCGNSQINALCHFKQNESIHLVLISSEDQLVIYDLSKAKTVETLISKKKSQLNPPHSINLSFDDKYTIEAYKQTINLRNLKSKQIIAKFEGHLHSITNLAFSQSSYVFLSSANNECLLWNPKEAIKSGTVGQEIANPDKILDLASSEIITQISLQEIQDSNTFIATVATDQFASVFFTKSSGNKSSVSKSKLVKKESTIRVTNQNEQIIYSNIINESSINVVYGSLFAIMKTQVSLMSDEGKVLKDIQLTSALKDENKSSTKKGKKIEEDYEVMGIEEEGHARVNGILNGRQLIQTNLALLHDADMDHLESKLTSVSSKNFKLSKSLTTVLNQALTADDSETLDWILAQKDEQMILNTLINLKDHKLISSLFKYIVVKFQQESNQQGVLLWLKALISMHWLSIVKKADKEDLQSLGQIQSYIQKKTKNMDRVLMLKGKLEMLGKTMELRKLAETQKEGIKTGMQQLLVYKDADDEDEEMNPENEDDEEEEESDHDESEDEEIKEIDIKQRKRQRKDEEDGSEDQEMVDIDDSIEDNDDDSEGDGVVGEGEDEEIDSEVYGAESDQYEKLAEDSDEDLEMADEEDESDDREVIKVSPKKR